MFNIVLYEPEIPPNTGNVIRLCANTGCRLHLIEPLGFTLEDSKLRRAGLDYHEWASIRVHAGWTDFLHSTPVERCFALSTKGKKPYHEVRYQAGDTFVFGPETRGLPAAFLAALDAERRLRLPMRRESRSLNLSNSVAIVIYEAWRQMGFPDGV